MKKRKQRSRPSANETDGPSRPLRRVLQRSQNTTSGNTDPPTKDANLSKDDGRKKTLRRRPGETLSEFSRRVDDAFDIKFKAGKSDIPLTKHQVRFKKKIENIRNDIKERGRKAEKIAEGEDGATNKYIQKRKRSPDPWLKLERRSAEFGQITNEPPKLSFCPRSKVTENVPKRFGQTERIRIGEERGEIIKKYREMISRGR